MNAQLDGSSNIDAAISTGTIFGIFEEQGECLIDPDADMSEQQVNNKPMNQPVVGGVVGQLPFVIVWVVTAVVIARMVERVFIVVFTNFDGIGCMPPLCPS